jgi:hypothetical protein
MARTKKEREKQGGRFCEICEWFNWRNDEPDAGMGYCRRYPPVIEVDKSAADGWPNVRLTDWCGEWQRRGGIT